MAFADCDVAILVGAIPRREGMERKDLLTQNAKIFKDQGSVIDKLAKKSVKVGGVGNSGKRGRMNNQVLTFIRFC